MCLNKRKRYQKIVNTINIITKLIGRYNNDCFIF